MKEEARTTFIFFSIRVFEMVKYFCVGFLFFFLRKSMAEEYIMTAAKLIAPVIETSFAVGYDW